MLASLPAPWKKPLALLEHPSACSILQQTPWESGFYSFPDEGENFNKLVEYFNPTIVQRASTLHLITRRRHVPSGVFGQNSLWTWRLAGTQPVQGQPIYIPKLYPGEHWEDPRIAVMDGGRELLSWCNFARRTYAHQCYGELFSGKTVPRVCHLVHGFNGHHIKANTFHEKNWTWFGGPDGSLRCSYLLAPQHVVLRVKNNAVQSVSKSDSSAAQKLWRWGEIRGGSSPIRIGHHYLVFFHSRLPWRFVRTRWFNCYYMGALLFESQPPFRITHITLKPLLEGSDHDPRNLGAPLCVFPCGAVLEGKAWLVALGVNDCRCAWLKVPHEALMARMVKL